jgi:hypothetical protein
VAPIHCADHLMTATHSQLRAIETYAYGCRFRSRLEARWAVFFDQLGVDWQYEPQGFDLGGEAYLPDFCVRTGDLVYWYEVKPREVLHCDKFTKFSQLITQDVDGLVKFNVEARLLSGDPFDVFQGRHICPRCGTPEAPEDFDDEIGFLCHPCDWVTASGGGNPSETGFAGVDYYPEKGWIMIHKDDYSWMLEKITGAYLSARRARFEHGEQP